MTNERFFTPTEPVSFEKRYDQIDELNRRSFWLHEPHFETRFSLHDTGGDPGNPFDIARLQARKVLAGNMSPVLNGKYGPVDLSPEERIVDAETNLDAFIIQQGVNPADVRILYPERDYSTPLTFVNVDDQEIPSDNDGPFRLTTSGDFLYTRNPNIVLAARPADCPIIIGTVHDAEGELHFLLHLAWMGAASDYISQAKDWFNERGVDPATFRLYITPGGHAETFLYEGWDQNPLELFPSKEGLFVNPRLAPHSKTGEMKWAFEIDTPLFVYNSGIKEFGIDPYQVFLDTSDTSALNSGYSSNTRSIRFERELNAPIANTRDIVLAWFNETQEK